MIQINNDMRPDLRREVRRMLYALAALVIFFILALLTSCRTKYVPIETVKLQDRYVDRVVNHRDSILVHDSVSIFSKGDTIYQYRFRNVYKDRYIFSRDSLYFTDSVKVQVPYPVERRLTKWQQVQMKTGKIAIIVSVIAILSYIVYIFVKKKIVHI